MNNPPSSTIAYNNHVQKAREHESVGDHILSLKEWKEAFRIWPDSVEAQNECARLELVAFPLQATPASSIRVTSHFNLSVRFWDRNMPSAALSEACEELDRLSLPSTCVSHNIKKMKEIMSGSFRTERELKSLLLGPKKNSVAMNYKLATLYYERMMLTAAEQSLNRCKDLCKNLVELEKNRQASCLAALSAREFDAQLLKSSRRTMMEINNIAEPPHFDYETLNRAEHRVEQIMGDIAHVKQLQAIYCTTTNETKILPCLASRFSDTSRAECENWWTALRASPLLVWPSSV